jgi:nucleoside-diphosphate-sugar epimerase
MSSPERVLITGASGFVGANLARAELAVGNEVQLLVRSHSGLDRLRDVIGRCQIYHADLRDPAALEQAVDRCRPEVVYHAAAQGTFHNQPDRIGTLTSNLLGTALLLDATRRHDLRAFVNVGSSSEYGHKSVPMCPEDRLEPRSDYGVAKAAATLLCQSEALQGRPVVTVRIFSAFGPWEDPARIASHVMACCRRGTPVRITAGHQPRDFIYIEDVVSLLQIAGRRPELRGQILHAGTGRRQTVRDMVETIIGVCDTGRAEYGARADRPDEPGVWVADIASTVALTGWRPTHDLRAGVEKMWAWFQASAGIERRASA